MYITKFINNIFQVDYGFAFGVAFTDSSGRPLVLDPSYFTLGIYQATTVNVSGAYQFVGTDLGYKVWDSNDLPNISKEFMERSLNSALYCPVNKRYKLAGNYLSKNYSFHYLLWIVLSIWKANLVLLNNYTANHILELLIISDILINISQLVHNNIIATNPWFQQNN